MQVNVDTNATLTTFSLGETADDAIEMQVDDETIDAFLQINLRQDEREQIDRLLDQPMEQPIDTPTSKHDPRDGSFASALSLTLPLLGPGDIEVTVEIPSDLRCRLRK